MSKKILMLLFLLFPLIVGLACLSSAPDPTATPREPLLPTEDLLLVPTSEATPTIEQQAPQGTQQPIDLVQLDQRFWTQDGSHVFVGYMFENPLSDLVFEDVEFTVTLVGFSGNLIETDIFLMPWFFADQTMAVVSNFWLADESVVVDSVEIDWTFSGTSPADDMANPFKTDSIIYWDNASFPNVSGKIVNNQSTTFKDIRANILCYNGADEIIGGGYTFIDFIHLNDYMGFITYVDVFGDVARVEVFPTLTYSTQFIEKTDFLSDISIQEVYFYEDNYQSIYGGLVAKNETKHTLRNSLFYVTFYDKDDHITSTGSAYIDLLLPGEALGVVPWFFTQPDDAISTRRDILILPGESEPDYELAANPFTVNSAALTEGDNHTVRVNFTNTLSKQVSEVDVFVLVYNADGQIIGGGKDWTSESIPPGGASEIEVWVTYAWSETIDAVKAWIAPNTWTEFE